MLTPIPKSLSGFTSTIQRILLLNTWIKPALLYLPGEVALALHSLKKIKSLLTYFWLNGSARAKNPKLQVRQVLSVSTIIKPTNVLFCSWNTEIQFKKAKTRMWCGGVQGLTLTQQWATPTGTCNQNCRQEKKKGNMHVKVVGFKEVWVKPKRLAERWTATKTRFYSNHRFFKQVA